MTATGLEVESMQSSLLARVARRARRDLPFFVLAGGIYGLDQLTKVLVRGGLALGESWPSESWLIKITHITNSGAAFGILQSQGVFLTITAFAAIAAIFFYYAYPPLEHGLLRFALGLLLGGAIGNLTDRLRFGEVTDFFDFPHYPAFNIADSSIVVGLVIVVAFLLLRGGGARSKSEAAIEPSSGSPPASRAEPGEPRPDTDG